MTHRDHRLFRDFDQRLRAARARAPGQEQPHEQRPSDYGPGFQAGIEVFGGVVGGLLLGWGLDTWLETTPILLVVFLLLGGAAGVRNAFRTLNRLVPDDEGR